jgi:hypothetical protein
MLLIHDNNTTTGPPFWNRPLLTRQKSSYHRRHGRHRTRWRPLHALQLITGATIHQPCKIKGRRTPFNKCVRFLPFCLLTPQHLAQGLYPQGINNHPLEMIGCTSRHTPILSWVDKQLNNKTSENNLKSALPSAGCNVMTASTPNSNVALVSWSAGHHCPSTWDSRVAAPGEPTTLYEPHLFTHTNDQTIPPRECKSIVPINGPEIGNNNGVNNRCS